MFTKYTGRTFIREVVLVLVGLVIIVPIYLLVVMAFKGTTEAAGSSPLALPVDPTFDNFLSVLSGTGSRSVVTGLLNSTIIAGGSLIGLILIGSIAAYTIARRPGRMGDAAYTVFVVGIILPFQLAMIPTYVAMRTLALVGTQWGMILLYIGLLMPLSVFLYTGFARALPRDYEEAAAIDGASKLRTFLTIVFPLLGPATGTVAILTGLIVWNDLFTALIFLSGSKATTLPVVVYNFVGDNVTEWNIVFAVVVISMIPILTFYLFAQKKFIQGFAGGMKG